MNIVAVWYLSQQCGVQMICLAVLSAVCWGPTLLVKMLNDFWALLTVLAVHWFGVVLLDEI